ncbi:hypothetical protein GALL_405550 [mine drainage metagenome]|uniref:Uncharacterized protein n=1 Tax=mine drainage metagenome TaxID=410659 RepID=A0A1J5Q357_9ZZZZ
MLMLVAMILRLLVMRLGARIVKRIGAAVFAQIDNIHAADLASGHRIRIDGSLGLWLGAWGARATVTLAAALIILLRTRIGALFVQQGFAVGLRDLIVIRVDFREREEAVAVAAVIDKSGLKRRLHPRHFRQINIAS